MSDPQILSRPVAPWTWRRALRDHGPGDAGVLLTLYVVGTFMDANGYAYPSQQRIAEGARASLRTVQRHIKAARTAGWLGVEYAGREGQGWRHYAYRAAVPLDVPLEDKDDEIATAIESQFGDVETW